MTRVYVIRHAEAEGNLYRIAQGQYDSILTDRGWRQLQALAGRFRDVHLDAVYASDLYRARATASAVARPKGLTVQPRRDLREICVGEWEEKTWGEIARTQPDQLEYFNHRGDLWHVEGGEAPAAVQARMLAAVREIVRMHPGETVALASHGCAIRLLLGALQGYTLPQIGQTPNGDNTAVSLLEAEGDAIRVVYRDDASHIPTENSALSRHTTRSGSCALEPGLYFEPGGSGPALDWICACVRRQWNAVLPGRAWDERVLREEAPVRPTLLAVQSGTPAGVVQLAPEKEAELGCGWISLYCLDESRQNRGLGIQLLGQAVRHYRPLGRERLRLCLPEENAGAQAFFGFYGFLPAGRAEDGRLILEKDIRFRPL